MKMSFLLCLLLVSTPSQADDNAPAEAQVIPPVKRYEVHLDNGVRYLTAISDGSRIEIHRADGARMMLRVEGGKLLTKLPSSTLEDNDRLLLTPLGYKLYVPPEYPGALVIESPNAHRTLFTLLDSKLVAAENDGGSWMNDGKTTTLRLPDGTRIDFLDEYRRVEALTMNGERFSRELGADTWKALGKLPSPPLIPDLGNYYLAGDGNDWRLPVHEEHLVFAWSWYPYGLPLANIVGDITKENRRSDLYHFFKLLDHTLPPAEAGGYLLARRLALGGGDWIVFKPPGGPEQTVFVLPGALEPDYRIPPRLDISPVRSIH